MLPILAADNGTTRNPIGNGVPVLPRRPDRLGRAGDAPGPPQTADDAMLCGGSPLRRTRLHAGGFRMGTARHFPPESGSC